MGRDPERGPADAPVGLRLRIPGWAEGSEVRDAGGTITTDHGWLEVPARRWPGGQPLHIDFGTRLREVPGDHGNAGKVALEYGPLVLAYGTDEDRRQRTPAFDVLAPAPRHVEAPAASGPVRVTTTIADPGGYSSSASR